MAVSAMGLGCMGLSGGYGAVDRSQALRTIHAAIDCGINLMDTADFYGRGANETLIGEVVAERRHQMVLATKTGMRPDENGRPTRIDGSPAYLREACENSLRRLKVEAIDILILCRVDPAVPIEESVGVLRDLVLAGKVREIGLSEASPATIVRAHEVHPLAVLETEYSLWERHVEDGILQALADMDIALLAYSPLGRGFLAGQIKSVDQLAPVDMRRHNPRYQPDSMAANKGFVDALERLAREKDATPAQVALAWLLHRQGKVIPIPGTRNPQRVRENAQAAQLVLTQDDLLHLEERLPPKTEGERYPPAFMAAIDG
mgnify:CR=1 FL=1